MLNPQLVNKSPLISNMIKSPQFQLSTYPQSVIINIFLFPMDPAILPSGRYSHLLVIVPPILKIRYGKTGSTGSV